jgi:hypothetical protein
MVGYLIIPICLVVLAIGCSLIGFVHVNLTLPKMAQIRSYTTKMAQKVCCLGG